MTLFEHDLERLCAGRAVFALEPVVSLPTGSDAFTSGGVDPMLKFIIDRALPGGFSVSANIVVSSDTDAGSRFTQQAY